MKALGREYIPKDEEKHINEMISLMKQNMKNKYPSGRMPRQFHPKMHGCVKAVFIVPPNLPEHLQKGLFAKAGNFDAWIRFSNAPPKIQEDYKASGRGMAIKVMDVEGERLLEDPLGRPTQDFVMTTSPVLSSGNARNYKWALKSLIYGFPHIVGYALWPGNWHRLYLTLKNMKKHPNLLEVPYFTGSPFRFEDDDTAVKFRALPRQVSKSYPKEKKPDLLRERLVEDLSRHDAWFDLEVQFQQNPNKQPIENTARAWKTPFTRVAEIQIPKQTFDTPDRRELGDQLAFSPWHGLEVHRPLGGINRVRKAVYEEMAGLRRGQVTK